MLRELTQSEFDAIMEQQAKISEQIAQRRYPHPERPKLANCKLYHITVPAGSNFEGMDLSGCEIERMTFVNCNFNFCNLSNTKIWGGKIDSCSFIGTEMTNTDFGTVGVGDHI
jgi:uncharacterized protein YjbI with pentapeptide repeats